MQVNFTNLMDMIRTQTSALTSRGAKAGAVCAHGKVGNLSAGEQKMVVGWMFILTIYILLRTSYHPLIWYDMV